MEDEIVNFELMDVLGKVQFSTQLDHLSRHTINLNNLREGIYFYRLIKNDNVTKSGKLIIE